MAGIDPMDAFLLLADRFGRLSLALEIGVPFGAYWTPGYSDLLDEKPRKLAGYLRRLKEMVEKGEAS